MKISTPRDVSCVLLSTCTHTRDKLGVVTADVFRLSEHYFIFDKRCYWHIAHAQLDNSVALTAWE